MYWLLHWILLLFIEIIKPQDDVINPLDAKALKMYAKPFAWYFMLKHTQCQSTDRTRSDLAFDIYIRFSREIFIE